MLNENHTSLHSDRDFYYTSLKDFLETKQLVYKQLCKDQQLNFNDKCYKQRENISEIYY